MRMYLMTWGYSFCKTGLRVCPETDITEDNGYRLEDIEGLKALEVGVMWTSSDYSDHSAILIPEGITVLITGESC